MCCAALLRAPDPCLLPSFQCISGNLWHALIYSSITSISALSVTEYSPSMHVYL